MLWYTSIFVLLLLLFSIIFYFTLQSALAAAVDADLKLRTQQIVAGITNDKGIISLAEVTEDLPQLDTNATGTVSTIEQSQPSHRRAVVNFGTLIRILDLKGQTIYVTPAFSTNSRGEPKSAFQASTVSFFYHRYRSHSC